MGNTGIVKMIHLEGIWTPEAGNDFDTDFKNALHGVQSEFGLDAFCTAGGEVEDIDFYEFELDESTNQIMTGVIYVSFTERIMRSQGKTFRMPHLLRYAFEFNRSLGELLLGEGVERPDRDPVSLELSLSEK